MDAVYSISDQCPRPQPVANAGARLTERTAQDLRLIEESRTRAGSDLLESPYESWIPDPSTVGGYPALPTNTHSLPVAESGLRAWFDGPAPSRIRTPVRPDERLRQSAKTDSFER